MITLRPATDGDRFRIRRWLADPHIALWWGSRAAAEAEIALAFDSPSALARIVELGGASIGYVHALDAGQAGTRRHAALPPGSYTAALFIGAEHHRGRGHGAEALVLLRRELFAKTLAPALALLVSIRNELAVRAIERAGFRWRAVVDDALLGHAWLLIAERD